MRVFSQSVRITLICCFGLLMSTVAIPREVSAREAPDRGEPDTQQLGDVVMRPDGRIRIIVQLEEPSMARYRGGIVGLEATSPRVTGVRKLDVKSPRARAYRGFLAERQGRFVDELFGVAPGAEVDHRYRVVFNGVAMTVDPDRVESISKMPGVKRVYRGSSPDAAVWGARSDVSRSTLRQVSRRRGAR